MMYDISKQYAVISPHVVFNVPFDLTYDKCYHLHSKTAFFRFCTGFY